jgi:alpha,alpha-trehalose phosphorylase (configuration-retaining)
VLPSLGIPWFHGIALEIVQLADSFRAFGPNAQPRLTVGFLNEVEVDVEGQAHLTTLSDYEKTVGERTWKAVSKYAGSLKKDQTRIAFFNSTPQGGGVALMRHALIRYLRLLGVDTKW